MTGGSQQDDIRATCLHAAEDVPRLALASTQMPTWRPSGALGSSGIQVPYLEALALHMVPMQAVAQRRLTFRKCWCKSYIVLVPTLLVAVQGRAQVPMLELRNGGDTVWEMDAKIGRAKAYLVGSPYATDFGFSNVLQGPLQVR